MQFYKYQGTGNDFILIDNRNSDFKVEAAYIESLCHRRFGIGADGLILLENQDGYDFRMVYFNADGKEGSMCGNGGRSIVKFAYDLGIIKNETRFIAIDGEHLAKVNGDIISLKMSDVDKIEFIKNDSYLNTGSPHFIREVADIQSFKVREVGKSIRYNDYWKSRGGVNVNFIEKIANDILFVRTYERGVEDETYSCGTGVTAASIHSYLKMSMNPPITVKTLGGELSVNFENLEDNFFNIYLSGPALLVFTGDLK